MLPNSFSNARFAMLPNPDEDLKEMRIRSTPKTIDCLIKDSAPGMGHSLSYCWSLESETEMNRLLPLPFIASQNLKIDPIAEATTHLWCRICMNRNETDCPGSLPPGVYHPMMLCKCQGRISTCISTQLESYKPQWTTWPGVSLRCNSSISILVVANNSKRTRGPSVKGNSWLVLNLARYLWLVRSWTLEWNPLLPFSETSIIPTCTTYPYYHS